MDQESYRNEELVTDELTTGRPGDTWGCLEAQAVRDQI